MSLQELTAAYPWRTKRAGRIMVDGEAITAPHPFVGIAFQESRLLPSSRRPSFPMRAARAPASVF